MRASPVRAITEHNSTVPFKATEIGALPKDWSVVSLGELLNFKNGVNADKTAYGHGMPFANVLEVITHTHLVEAHIPGRVALMKTQQDMYSVRNGDILFNRTSETQEEIGLASVYIGSEPIVFGGFVIRGRPLSDKLHRGFSAWILRAPAVHKQIISRGQGAVRANIGQADLRTVLVPLPPLREQEAIAKALGDSDALIASLEQLITKKRAIKQGAMQELLTGRRRLPEFKGKWQNKRLEEIADIDPESIGGSTSHDYVFKYISLEDVESGSLRSYSEQLFETAPSRARRRVRRGDILVATVRPNLKSHLRFSGTGNDWICSTGFCVVRCREKIAASEFVFSHFFSRTIERQIEALLTGSNYPAINSGDVKALLIPVPELDEQIAIGIALSDMDTEIAALEAKLAKAHAVKQGMMQELLTGKVRLV